jgi:ribosomal protein S18 acetylase RimI-like enzyme
MVVRSANVSRGLGVGRLLLSRLERYGAGQGYPRVWVATGDPAVAFYRRRGWEETERLPPSRGNQGRSPFQAGHEDSIPFARSNM